jgi:hypothetical protein
VVELTQTVNKLKGLYSSWQEVNDKRRSIVSDVVSLATERRRVGKLVELWEVE